MNLDIWVEASEISKRKLAEELNINESTLYKYLNRTRMPRLDIAIKIVELSDGVVTFEDMVLEEFQDKGQKVVQLIRPIAKRNVMKNTRGGKLRKPVEDDEYDL